MEEKLFDKELYLTVLRVQTEVLRGNVMTYEQLCEFVDKSYNEFKNK